MAGIEEYRRYVIELLKQYGRYKPSYGDVEVELIFDRENDHYQLMTVGWNKQQRIHGCIAHIDINGGKIWIQHDGTEIGLANELVELGVPKEDIVLAFHAPYKWQFTGFAVS
jgi:hypothetical protein